MSGEPGNSLNPSPTLTRVEPYPSRLSRLASHLERVRRWTGEGSHTDEDPPSVPAQIGCVGDRVEMAISPVRTSTIAIFEAVPDENAIELASGDQLGSSA